MFVSGKSRTIFFPSNTLIYGISRDGSKNFNIRTCEHMILSQLRIRARATTYAALPHTHTNMIFLRFLPKQTLFLVICKRCVRVWSWETPCQNMGFRKMLVYKLLIHFLSPFTSTLIWTQRPEGQCDLVVMAVTPDPAYYDNYTISTAAKEL